MKTFLVLKSIAEWQLPCNSMLMLGVRESMIVFVIRQSQGRTYVPAIERNITIDNKFTMLGGKQLKNNKMEVGGAPGEKSRDCSADSCGLLHLSL